MTDTLRIPLRSRSGQVRAHAVVDLEDAHLVDGPWSYSFGYAVHRNPDGRTESMHRTIAGCVMGDGMWVDHIDGDKLNNRRENLRVVTPAQSGQNIVRRPGLRGVTWHERRGKWMARAQFDGRDHFLGYHATAEEAAQVASDFRREHMPFTVEARCQ